MQGHDRSAVKEWSAHWPMVLAATAGFSLHPVATYAIGLFMQPLGREFGWNRAQITIGLTLTSVAMIFLSPMMGAWIDRWGSRWLAIIGTMLTAISIASFGLADGSFSQWIVLWSIFAVVSLASKPTVWTAAVSSVFSAGRGVALGVTMSGVAIAQILAPPLAYSLIERFGWRHAFIALGLGWGAVVIVPVVLFLFDAHDHERKHAKANPHYAARAVVLSGLTIREAVRSVVLWRIGAASFLTMLLGIGVVVHQVPILTEAGLARQHAAFLASLAGAAGILGKFVTGWLMDRSDAGRVGSITLAMAGLGFLLLSAPFGSIAVMILAMLIIGYSTGAKLQISAYLTSRYGGMRNFGKIFGVVASLVAAGAGMGPLLAGAIRDAYGSYAPMLLAGTVGSLVCGLLIFRLGPYPRWHEPGISSIDSALSASSRLA